MALCFEAEPGAQLERALRDAALRLNGSRLSRERDRVRLLFPANRASLP